jgi:GMP synthase (glutamine-hydrolysing)
MSACETSRDRLMRNKPRRSALVLQHISCEPPGAFGDVLNERDVEIVTVELDEGGSLPDWREFDYILAMGGPMSVNDDARLPWLTGEKRLIADAVRAGKPFWGTCLGVQLLAASLGGRVYAGSRQEIGLMPVQLLPAARQDPLFRDLPDGLLTFQWHGDTFDVPDGGVLLARSPLFPNQAFRWGANAYGIQFHLEVSAELARAWGDVPEYREGLERTLGPGALDRIVADLEGQGATLVNVGRVLFERWLALPVAASARAS